MWSIVKSCLKTAGKLCLSGAAVGGGAVMLLGGIGLAANVLSPGTVAAKTTTSGK